MKSDHVQYCHQFTSYESEKMH